MNISKRLLAGISGLVLGAVMTTILAQIAMSLFYKGGGFVIDFAPLLILIYGIIWGGFSGALVGFLMQTPLKSLLAGLVLALVALTLLFFANAAEKNFADAASSLIKSLSSSIGIYCFIIITTFSGFVIGAFNQAIINQKNNQSEM